ncbi:MAG: F0F1 ATP synthase subunit gamma [Rhodospirillaceae bacterium]|nr:F0F1 ATP synthase subunit gamma [Rhodospirillaceae bacterium]
MASLKDLRIRITSVQSTKKITSAMKMVAASKLRRAQEAAEQARPYAQRMEGMLGNLAAGNVGQDGAPRLLAGTGKDHSHLIIVMTANRGLCGGFNTNIIRSARALIRDLQAQGKNFKIYTVGRKSRDNMKRDFADHMVGHFDEFGRTVSSFSEAEHVAQAVTSMFDAGDFDVCTLVYANFISAITQEVTRQQVIPFPVPEVADGEDAGAGRGYEYEPSDTEILTDLLPRNLAIQIFRALLENGASEQGARMSAMDSATRNAGEMIDKLKTTYNRTRQAQITTELIEIISGAEAL